jgi:O-acetyl-ADP-ribose deacetylase (regulator of RNase III)
VLTIINGDIFQSDSQTIVNTINCVGVMGKGIALEYKNRYPKMFTRYQELCKLGLIKIGSLWLYNKEPKWVLNFPTKLHWKNPSKIEYLEMGLEKFVETYNEKGITSISFPLLGASNGGIDPEISLRIMSDYLKNCEIPIKIFIKK